MSVELVVVEWDDLLNGSLPDAVIERAYGPFGAGVMGIRGVPGFLEAKSRLLETAHTLATLPTEYLEENLTDPDVRVGLSHLCLSFTFTDTIQRWMVSWKGENGRYA